MTATEIIETVSKLTGITPEEMKTPGRNSRRVMARTLAANEIRTSCMGFSLQDIGDLFGMGHSNIAHTLTRHSTLMQVDSAYQRAAKHLSQMNLQHQYQYQ